MNYRCHALTQEVHVLLAHGHQIGRSWGQWTWKQDVWRSVSRVKIWRAWSFMTEWPCNQLNRGAYDFKMDVACSLVGKYNVPAAAEDIKRKTSSGNLAGNPLDRAALRVFKWNADSPDNECVCCLNLCVIGHSHYVEVKFKVTTDV